MDKIENLKSKSGRFYYNLSKKYYDYKKDTGTYDAGLLAIPFLKKACEIEENGEYYYALSTLFFKSNSIFEMNMAMDYLVLALKNGFDKEAVYRDLYDLSIRSGNDDGELFYGNLLNINEEDRNKKKFKVVVDNDEFYRDQFKNGMLLVLSNNKEGAVNILKTIDNKDSAYYTQAMNALIQTYIELEQYVNALDLINKLNSEHKSNSGTLGLYVMLLQARDGIQDREEIEDLLNASYIDEEGASMFLTACCTLKLHNVIIKKGLNLLNDRPYDVHLLFIIGIAYLNIGEYEIAKEFFRKGSIIKDLFGLFSYYYEVTVNLIVDENIGNTPMVDYSYNLELPLSEEVTRKKDLLETEIYFNENLLNPLSKENKVLDWVFLNGDETLVNRVLDRITFKLGKKINKYLENMMLSNFYSGYTKRRIMYYYLLNNPSDTFYFLNDGIYKECRAIKYKQVNSSEIVFRAMSHVYSCLIRVLDGFDEELVRAVNSIKDLDKIKTLTDENLIAYHILKRMIPQIEKENLMLILDIPVGYIKEKDDD